MNESPKTPKRRWVTYRFGPEHPPLEPFDLTPVSDIPIRQAVEEGALKMNKELSLYITTTEWNGHPPQTPVIAGLIEDGKPFAVWVGRKQASMKSPTHGEGDSENEVENQKDPSLEATPTLEPTSETETQESETQAS